MGEGDAGVGVLEMGVQGERVADGPMNWGAGGGGF